MSNYLKSMDYFPNFLPFWEYHPFSNIIFLLLPHLQTVLSGLLQVNTRKESEYLLCKTSSVNWENYHSIYFLLHFCILSHNVNICKLVSNLKNVNYLPPLHIFRPGKFTKYNFIISYLLFVGIVRSRQTQRALHFAPKHWVLHELHGITTHKTIYSSSEPQLAQWDRFSDTRIYISDGTFSAYI
jgi:hypothetical protein